MRTTLTIEPDVAQQIRRRMAQTKLPLRRVVNDALRIGLSSPEKEPEVRYTVETYPANSKPASIRASSINSWTTWMRKSLYGRWRGEGPVQIPDASILVYA